MEALFVSGDACFGRIEKSAGKFGADGVLISFQKERNKRIVNIAPRFTQTKYRYRYDFSRRTNGLLISPTSVSPR